MTASFPPGTTQTAVASAVRYKGTWDASTNTPHLQNGTGTNGDFYITRTAGSQTFGGTGSIAFTAGDYVIYDGAAWKNGGQSQIAVITEAPVNVENYGARLDDSTDDTAAINSALNAYPGKEYDVYIDPRKRGRILGRVNVPAGVNILNGVGGGRWISNVGGLLCVAVGAGVSFAGFGGRTVLQVDGNNVSNNPLYIGASSTRRSLKATVQNALQDCALIEYAQNLTLDLALSGAGRHCLLLDRGCGGLRFDNMEASDYGRSVAGHGVHFGANSGVGGGVYTYPTEIAFVAGRIEQGNSVAASSPLYAEAGFLIKFGNRFGFSGPYRDGGAGGPFAQVDLVGVGTCLDWVFDHCDFTKTSHGTALYRAIRTAANNRVNVYGGFYDSPAGFLDIAAGAIVTLYGLPWTFVGAPLVTDSAMLPRITGPGLTERVGTALTLNSPWVNNVLGYQTAQYRMDASRRVHLGGTVVRGGGVAPPSGEVVATLPAGYRPAASRSFPVVIDDATITGTGVTGSPVSVPIGRLDILNTGELKVYSRAVFLSLDGVSFTADA